MPRHASSPETLKESNPKAQSTAPISPADSPPSPEGVEQDDLPEGWRRVPFLDAIRENKTRVAKVRQSAYQKTGRYPVIDQGQQPIAGYWDNQDDVYRGELPVIVFGDHTRAFKFVDFPFVVGADGTHVLAPNKECFDTFFLYLALSSLYIPSRGYNRHFGLLRERSVVAPPLHEQRAIAEVLLTVQQAKEATEKVIAATRPLKASLMKHLFTYGPVPPSRADRIPLKETEVGPTPQHWQVRPIGEFARLAQYGLSVRGSASGRYPMLRMNNLQDGQLVTENVQGGLQYVDVDDAILPKFHVAPGDLLFNRTNSFELVGKTALFALQGDFVFASYLVRLRLDTERLDARFTNFYLNLSATQARLKLLASRGVSQSNINARKLKAFDVPVPPLAEQQEISAQLAAVDAQLAAEERRRMALDVLFKSLLHHLMTGQIRLPEFARGST